MLISLKARSELINITKLYRDEVTPGDWLRYGQGPVRTAAGRKPVVVWNITRTCNLKCVHCYNDSSFSDGAAELTTEQAKAVLDDLAEFAVPVVLFSGGEPLMRPDLFDLISHASEKGLNSVISTNGTLITPSAAGRMKQLGVTYVGISLDGVGKLNDDFRGVQGAYQKALQGIRYCMAAGLRVGLRITLTQRIVQCLENLFDLVDAEGIQRVCFYHLVPSGRSRSIADQNLTHAQTRELIETILEKALALKEAKLKREILTVDNHVDGVYLYLKLLAQDKSRAEKVRKLLKWNGGGLYSSGVGIGCIDYNGKVHPDQFWSHYDLGDVREKPFSAIWTDAADPLLKGLRNRRKYIKGRCRLCRFFDLCGGSLRARADLYFGDPWAPEPACYLTDEEIGLDEAMHRELVHSGEIFRAYPNNPLVMRPSEKFEAKAAGTKSPQA
ncbi:MAG: radical SAM protein [Planctomycetota bacterium]